MYILFLSYPKKSIISFIIVLSIRLFSTRFVIQYCRMLLLTCLFFCCINAYKTVTYSGYLIFVGYSFWIKKGNNIIHIYIISGVAALNSFRKLLFVIFVLYVEECKSFVAASFELLFNEKSFIS